MWFFCYLVLVSSYVSIEEYFKEDNNIIESSHLRGKIKTQYDMNGIINNTDKRKFVLISNNRWNFQVVQ